MPVVVTENERIKMGIIGLGDRGSSIIQVLNQIPEIKTIACCDILDFRLEEGLKKIEDKAIPYTDYRKLLENKDLDAVIISTPLHEHHRMVIDALDADLHIMCEKTLAHNIEQSIAIKTRADQSSKLFQISYQYQLNPVFNAIKEIIQEGYCGKISRVDAAWHRNHNWRREVPSPELERQINWRMYKEYSGGLMAELGSHQLNMIDNIIGDHPIKVVGTGGIDYWKDGRETFDNVHAIFDYPSGVKASFSSNLANAYEGFNMKFYGDKGTIVSNSMEEAFLYPEKDEDKKWIEDVDGITGASIKLIDKNKRRSIEPTESDINQYPFDNNYMNTTWLLYKNFIAAIKGTEDLQLGLKAGYQSSISVHLANMAIREDQVIHWLPEYNI
jgi:predicted dehydrogenase